MSSRAHAAARTPRLGARFVAAVFLVAFLAVLVLSLATALAKPSLEGHIAGAAPSVIADELGPFAPAPTPEITISATGDVALGSTPELPPNGARSLFTRVAPELRGDLVLGNLETALSDDGSSKCARASTSCFSFRAPPTFAGSIKAAGFTMLNLANNHSFDYGAAGQAETVAALAAAQLRSTGRPDEIAYQQVRGTRIAVVGFAPYPWAQDLRDLDEARRIVGRAAAAADLVVVTMHAGAEGNAATRVPIGAELHLGENRGDTRAFAHAVVDAGADLVLGHGPHVLRGLEWYRGRLVAYSLGNFSAYRNFALTGASGVSGILQVSLREDGSWGGGRLVPVRLVGDGTPELDPNGAGIAAIRRLSKSDFGARGMRVAESGELSPPGRGTAAGGARLPSA